MDKTRGGKLIFFDFDGVIADSFDAAFAVNKMIYSPIKPEEYRKRFDGNINGCNGSNRGKKEYRADIDFFKEYNPLLLRSPIFPGMKGVFENLGNSILVVVSSSMTSAIKEYLALHEIDHHFAEVMGNDVHASKVKKMEVAMDRFGVGAENCIFVTDTLGDIREARHLGIKAVAVTWGYQSRESLEQGDPAAIVDTPKDLPEVLTKL